VAAGAESPALAKTLDGKGRCQATHRTPRDQHSRIRHVLILSKEPAMRYLLLCLALSGCANGVQMTAEERVRCRSDGCAVFTEDEIRALVGKVFKDGYETGWKDAHKQTGRDI
jgi:hypothetical protein